MKKIFLIFLISFLLMGCATDCSKCPAIVQTKVIVPTIACYQPKPFEELQKDFLSTEGIDSEGKLLEIISINVKMMEMHIILWQGYRDCVNKIIDSYNNIEK